MTDRAGSTDADDLLELLTKVPDVSTLEILLEPKHLLQLLRAQGWSDADIRRELTKGGSTPGKLLLGVLEKEKDCSVLLGILGNPAPPVAAAKAPARPAAAPGLSPGTRAVTSIIVGVLLAGASGWYLFVRLDLLRVPGLIVYFPGAYTLLFTGLVVGLMAIGMGVRGLSKR